MYINSKCMKREIEVKDVHMGLGQGLKECQKNPYLIPKQIQYQNMIRKPCVRDAMHS